MINKAEQYYHYHELVIRLLTKQAQNGASEFITSKLKQYKAEHLEAYQDAIGSKQRIKLNPKLKANV